MSPSCVLHLGHEVQITRHITEKTQVDAPTYEVQCLCNGKYFYVSQACLVPKTQEKGDWSALAQWYKPPTQIPTMAEVSAEFNRLATRKA
jgi:hypothetical protein